MSRFLLFTALLIPIAFVACKGDDKTTVITSAPAEQTGITVEGLGRVEARPDVAIVQVGVSVQEATVAAAREAAAKAADAVVNSAKGNGVADRDLQTTNFGIQPVYSYEDKREPRIIGYMVSNTLRVKVRKIDDVGKVIDGATAAGGDAARVQGISFEIDDNEKLLDQAREAAMNDARKKAEQLARLGGVKLGAPMFITEVISTPPQPQSQMENLSRGDVAQLAATPIEPGTGMVTVTISVRWALGG